MRINFTLIAAIALLPLSCKKEIRPIETPPAVDIDLCTGNSWQFDNFFKGHHAYLGGVGTVYTMPIIYDDKVYVFNPDQDIIRIYDGIGWTSISSPIPFDNPVDIGFALGNKGYIMPVFDQNFWQYNFTNNTWAQKAGFPGQDREGWTTAVFTIGNKGYIAGGTLFGTKFSDTWEYNQASNVWTQKAHFSLFGMAGVVGFSIGNKGYLANGVFNWPNAGDIYSNNLQEFDPATNSWTAKADFPGGARAYTHAFVIGGIAYVGGGSKEGIQRKDYYKYTPGTNSWARIADVPSSSNDYFSFSINSRGYVVFHEDSNQTPPDEQFIYKYTPRFCTTLGPSLPVTNASPID